jgi:hypothetical protein
LFYQTSNVREFLARALPWPQEGEQPTYVNVHYGVKIVDKATNEPVLRGGKQLVTFPGKACRSVEEAARTIDWAMNTMQRRLRLHERRRQGRGQDQPQG